MPKDTTEDADTNVGMSRNAHPKGVHHVNDGIIPEGHTSPEGAFSPPVETSATPAPRTTDLKGLASAKHVTVDGLDLDVIATHDPHSSWTYSTEGMSCGNCSALVPTDPDLVFCPNCGVGYVVRAYVGIAP